MDSTTPSAPGPTRDPADEPAAPSGPHPSGPPPSGPPPGGPPPGGPPPSGPPPSGPPSSGPPPGEPHPWPTSGPAPGHGRSQPDGGSAFFESLRRSGLVRSSDRWIGGVAGGIARRLNVDPLIVRGAFVVLALFGGLAVVLYGLAWALLPEEYDGRIHLQEAIRGRFDAALAGAAAFVVVGLARPVFWFDPDRWVPGWLIALAWIGLVVTVIVVGVTAATTARRGRPGPHTPPSAPPQNGAPPMSSPSSPSGPTPYPVDQPPRGPAATSPAPGATAPYPAPPPGAYRPPGYGPAYHPPAAGAGTAAPGAAPTQARAAGEPPRPPTPGPGPTTVAIVIALALFAAAAVLLAHRAGVLTGSAALTAAGAVIVVLGTGALVSGVRGRRAGALAGTAVVLAVLAVPAAVVSNAVPDLPGGIFDDGRVIAGDVVWTPTTVSDAERGFSYALGEARIDLTGPAWPTSAEDGPTTVAVEAGAGSTTVVVPTGVPLEVRAHVGAGAIDSVLAGDWTRVSDTGTASGSTTTDDAASTRPRVTRNEAQGTNLDVVLRSPSAAGEDDLVLVVTIDAGLGDVTIEEEIR